MAHFLESWESASDGESAGQGISGELSTRWEEPATPRGRRADRVPVHLGAGLRQRGASGIGVEILDLSTHGFRVLTHLELVPGTDVWLRLPGLEACHARVCWAENNAVGCEFVRPLHPAVLAMIVDKAKGR